MKISSDIKSSCLWWSWVTDRLPCKLNIIRQLQTQRMTRQQRSSFGIHLLGRQLPIIFSIDYFVYLSVNPLFKNTVSQLPLQRPKVTFFSHLSIFSWLTASLRDFAIYGQQWLVEVSCIGKCQGGIWDFLAIDIILKKQNWSILLHIKKVICPID